VIRDLLHDLKQSAIDALAYVIATAFFGWLFMPEEVTCLL